MLNKLSLRFRKYFTFYRHTECYDEAVMPSELRKAHLINDRAVMETYGFWEKLNSESECVVEFMGMYKELTEKQLYVYWVRKEAIP